MLQINKALYVDTLKYREIDVLSYSILRNVPDYEKTISYLRDGVKYSDYINNGNLIDLLLFIEDWEDHVMVLSENVNTDFIRYVVENRMFYNLGKAYKEFTGKYLNYKDKTVEDKYITESVKRAIENYREDLIFVGEDDFAEAKLAVKRILEKDIIDAEFNHDILTAQVDIIYELPFEILGQKVKLKGLIDAVATSPTGYKLIDLKTTSRNPLKAFHEGKWALQAAIYSYLFANTAPEGEMLDGFYWIVYHRPTRNVYLMKAEVNGKYIKGDNIWELQRTGQEDESIVYQYLVGSESAGVMSLFDRIAWYVELEKDNFEIDPKSKDIIEIKPISAFNI